MAEAAGADHCCAITSVTPYQLISGDGHAYEGFIACAEGLMVQCYFAQAIANAAFESFCLSYQAVVLHRTGARLFILAEAEAGVGDVVATARNCLTRRSWKRLAAKAAALWTQVSARRFCGDSHHVEQFADSAGATDNESVRWSITPVHLQSVIESGTA